MTSSSKHGPGIYVGAVCMVHVGAPASQGHSQQDPGCLLFLLRLILSTTQRQPTPQAEFGCPGTKHIVEERSYFVYS